MTKEGNREPTASVQRRLEFGKVVVFKGGDCKSKCRVMSARACVWCLVFVPNVVS